MAVSTYVSVTILIANGLNAPKKKTDMPNGHKYKSHIYIYIYICCLKKTHF